MRDIELVPWNLAQIRHKDQSDAFANLVVEELKDHVPLAPKPVEHAPFRVLESANMPAVMLEIGYLSNPAQEKQIANGEFQIGDRAGPRRRDRAVPRRGRAVRGRVPMSRRSVIIIATPFVAIALTALIVVLAVRRKPAPPAAAAAATATAPAAPVSQGRKIKAQLFYVSDDGMRLAGVERDVPYAEQPVDQAREILNAQMAPVGRATRFRGAGRHRAARVVSHRERPGVRRLEPRTSPPRIPADRSMRC